MVKKTNVLRLLDQQKISYQTVTYPYDSEQFTPEKMQEFIDFDIRLLYKTLVGKGNKSGFLVGVIPKNKSLNFKVLSKASGNRKMRLIPQKDLQEVTGYLRGGCSPLGMKKKFPVYLDESMKAFNEIYVNAGQRGLLVGLNPLDLEKLAEATFLPIAI